MIAGVLLRTQPDDRLAALAGDGSKQAFEEIVRRHRGALVGFAAKIAPSARADDVVQESMVKAYLALQRGDRPDAPKAWLYRIVRNTALNERRDWREFEHLDENYDGVEQPPQAAERRSEMRNLLTALGSLPESQRAAIVQRELEGRGHDEIAASLGTSPGAVRQLIFRAREALRAGMGALVPVQILRMALASGGAEPAVGGAVGAGLGATALKVGFGAALATGVVVAGVGVDDSGKRKQQPNEVVITQPGTAQAAAQPTGSGTGAAAEGAPAGETKRGGAGVQPDDTGPPPPRPHGDRHRDQQGAPPPGGGSPGGGGTGAGGGGPGGSGGSGGGEGEGGQQVGGGAPHPTGSTPPPLGGGGPLGGHGGLPLP